MGFFIEGLFIGSELRNDGSGFNVLVSVGMDAYRVKVPDSCDLDFGCKVKIEVKPSVYNNRLYLTGEIV